LRERCRENFGATTTAYFMEAQTETLAFQRLDPEAVLPTRGSAAAAGLDLYSIEPMRLEPGDRVLARTGLAVAIPEGFYGRVAPRSGLATKNGLDVLAGVIVVSFTTPAGKPLSCPRKRKSAS
jgi:dUTPase